MRNSCVETSVSGEKAYKLFLDIVKLELDVLGCVDINCIQALILMNINENVVTIGEVLSRGYYIGSNASYNLRKMISNGYVNQTPSDYDKRAAYLKLTSKGLNLYEKLDAALQKHATALENTFKNKTELDKGLEFLKKVESFWKETLTRHI